ncbi:hypothetical protein E3N88_27270 [Mikania micrantha]|uniref:Uncharacterized protein n=1 Tax=Mikania micrantha TaxID=192012 RepID=A0A5N6MW77_9ASTR|nr:hypothetical protein E3N88_27270 [Mikania micrantha]
MRNCRDTRQTSRRVDSRIPSRSAKNLSGLSPRLEGLGSKKKLEHHHLPSVSVESSSSRGLRICSTIVPVFLEPLKVVSTPLVA